MQFPSTLLLIAASLAPLALADTHKAGLCIDNEGGQKVYNDAATKAACGNYLMRNKGTEWWNTCPDCKIANKGGIDFCSSEAGHIGGDELADYCKLNGAHGSAAD